MPVEIERRFLVRDPHAAMGARTAASSHITQGYFGHVDRLRVRVRVLSGKLDLRYRYSRLPRWPMPFAVGGRGRAPCTGHSVASPWPDARELVAFKTLLEFPLIGASEP